ncbi:MFS transporter [Streptomyces sp. S.PNR 29]|uniref:MFS transporter n=1 Tax=Streptomyces sp. S.PNR 29 TaxID=2973805 RepID=UPI0025AEF7C7|nr:MFS transporter [Streptomyces sp. S.PNR 29]MDN0200265.1 MFS transporter [Streptomyces sp. S.PNR 29]
MGSSPTTEPSVPPESGPPAPPPDGRPVPLRRHRPLLLLLTEQLTSSVGRQVTALALPLLAIAHLSAGPLGASALMAMTYLPGVLLSPLIGVAVDRARLRRLLVSVTWAQVPVIGSVPLAAALDGLTWPHLLAAAAVSGALNSTQSVALQSCLPRVVPSERLLPANSSLTGARTVGLIGGPALGGILIGIVDPAPALLVECAAYVIGGALFLALPTALNRSVNDADANAKSRIDALKEGLAVIRRETLLRRQALAAAGLNLGGGAGSGLFILYADQELGLPPWQLGTVYAAYAVGMGTGVLVATAATRALGMARTIQVCALGAGAALFLIPAASLGPAFPVLVLYELLFGLLATVWSIAMTTGRQLITPAHLLGRVNSFLQAVLTATLPLGAFAGGWLASRVGIVPVLIGAAAVALAGASSLWFPRDLLADVERAAQKS